MAKGQSGGGDAASEGIRHHEIRDVKKETLVPESFFSKEGNISVRTFCMNPLPDADYFGEKTFRKVFE
jgi:hypothetical protein